MRLRPFIGAALLVGGFWYLTSAAHWNPEVAFCNRCGKLRAALDLSGRCSI